MSMWRIPPVLLLRAFTVIVPSSRSTSPHASLVVSLGRTPAQSIIPRAGAQSRCAGDNAAFKSFCISKSGRGAISLSNIFFGAISDTGFFCAPFHFYRVGKKPVQHAPAFVELARSLKSVVQNFETLPRVNSQTNFLHRAFLRMRFPRYFISRKESFRRCFFASA